MRSCRPTSPAFFHLSRRVAAGMIARGSGKIIQIGSVQSQLARPSIAAYSATKGAIVMFTKGLCADLAPHGIQANAIAPVTSRPLSRSRSSMMRSSRHGSADALRPDAGATPETLVGALLFLAGGASDFVNGQTLFVDGGMTAVV